MTEGTYRLFWLVVELARALVLVAAARWLLIDPVLTRLDRISEQLGALSKDTHLEMSATRLANELKMGGAPRTLLSRQIVAIVKQEGKKTR